MAEQLERRLLLASGDLDTTFGTGGVVTSDFFLQANAIRGEVEAIAVQPDGKIVAAGSASVSGNNTKEAVAIVRFNTDGSLDSTFDGDGKFFTTLFTNAAGVAIQSNGKTLVLSDVFLVGGSNVEFAVLRLNVDGSVDTTFDGDGLATISFTGTNTLAADITVQNDGRIVVAGTLTSSSSQPIAVARLNADGSLDTTFDGDGRATIGGAPGLIASSVSVRSSDGVIIVSGSDFIGSKRNFSVAQFLSNGMPDTSFDGDGLASVDFGNLIDAAASDLVIQPDGKVVVGGDVAIFGGTLLNGETDFGVIRLNLDGSLDSSFGSAGKVLTSIASGNIPQSAGTKSQDLLTGIALQNDGKIVVTGKSTALPGPNNTLAPFVAVRYLPSGALDSSFANSGVLLSSIHPIRNESANAITIQSDGKIVLGGFINFNGNFSQSGFAVARYNPDGSLDTSFSGDGKVLTANALRFLPAAFDDEVRSVAVQSDGKIVVGGASWNDFETTASSFDFSLARYTANGTLDPTFGVGGHVYAGFDFFSEDSIQSIKIQSDGKIVAAGTSRIGTDYFFALMRFNPDGTLDSTFDSDGKLLTTIQTSAISTDLVIQSDGKLLVVGGSTANLASALFQVTLARYNPNGSLDTTLDSDGVLITSISQLLSFDSGDLPRVAVDSQQRIVALAQGTQVLRFLSNGATDTSFNGIGSSTSLFLGARDLVVQPDDRIVVGGSTTGSSGVFLARLTTTGQLDPTFANSGFVGQLIGNPPDIDLGYAVVQQPDGKFLLVGKSGNSSTENFPAIVRFTADGELDTTFNGDGKQVLSTITDLGISATIDATLDGDGRVVLAGTSISVRGDESKFELIGLLNESVVHPTLTITGGSVAEGNVAADDRQVPFTLSLSQAATVDVTGTIAVASNGQAVPGVDFTDITGATFRIPAGAISVVVNVPVIEDTDVEGDESFSLTATVDDPSRVTNVGGVASAIGTILNDDSPTLTVIGGSVLEGNVAADNRQVPFTLSLSAASAVPIAGMLTVSTNGPAVLGVDFENISGTRFVIPAGTTSLVVNVPVIEDTDFEADEMFPLIVTVDDPSLISNTQGTSTGFGTILNDDFVSTCSFVVTTTADSGLGSLRSAIICANDTANIDRDGLPGVEPDPITFAIPGAGSHTIQVLSALPTVTDPVVINGISQSGATRNTNGPGLGSNANLLIELNGSQAGEVTDGLVITAGASTVSGLVINRFGGSGIRLASGGNNLVTSNYIGIDRSGATDLGNAINGVTVVDSAGNVIGGSTAATRNVISGNNGHGVAIFNEVSSDNIVRGNFIGTAASGTAAVGNAASGVFIQGSSGNLIGSDLTGARNLLSGNGGSGVDLRDDAAFNEVLGNYIGTDVTGNVAIGNGEYGVGLYNAQNNLIGNTTPTVGTNLGNLISGNLESGVHIDSGSISVGNPSADNFVQGNVIGLNAAGIQPLGNAEQGVVIINSQRNTIGGATASAGNLISANSLQGVLIESLNVGEAAAFGASDNVIQFNKIGTDISGVTNRGNLRTGVLIDAADRNLIRDNIIAFNSFPVAGTGISVASGVGNAFLQNSIFDNLGLGINLAGGVEIHSSGVTANDDTDADSGANNLQNYPVLTSAATEATTVVQGTFNSLPNQTFRIEFFANFGPDNSLYGEGRSYLGSQNVVTDNLGDAVISFVSPTLVSAGQLITSTATLVEEFDGVERFIETSEFSRVVPVTGDVVAQADLSLSKRVDKTTANVGDTVTFTATLANFGPDAATNIRVADGIPVGVSNITVTPAIGTFTAGVWTIDTLANGETTTLTITGQVAVGSAPITNIAEVIAVDQFDPNSNPNNQNPDEDDQDSATVTVLVADLSLTKTADKTLANIGDTVTFTVTLANEGPNSATNIRVADAVPAGLSGVNVTPSLGTYVNGVWFVPTLRNEQTATLIVVGQVSGVSPITNTAEIIAVDQFDPDSTPNNQNPVDDDQAAATVSVTADPQADLSLTKTVEQRTTVTEDEFTVIIDGRTEIRTRTVSVMLQAFTVTIANNGPQAATNIRVSDPIPTGLLEANVTPSIGTYANGVWSIPLLANGNAATLTMLGSFDPFGDQITNTAEIIAVDQVDPDSIPNNHNPSEDDQANATTNFARTQVADLSLAMAVDKINAIPGDTVTFTIVVTNSGPDAATNVQIEDFVPGALGDISYATANGAVVGNIWTIASLSEGESAVLTLTGRIDSSESFQYVAEVIGADQFDPDSTPGNQNPDEDDQASALVVVSTPQQIADLSLAITVDNSNAQVGQNVTLTVALNNAGPDEATGVSVSSLLPTGLQLVQAILSVGSYDSVSGEWIVGVLEPNTTATLQIVAMVVTDQSVRFDAQVSRSDQFDPDSTPGNNATGEDDQFIVQLGSCLTGGPLTAGRNRFVYSCVTPGGFAAFVVGTHEGSHHYSKWGSTVDIADPSVPAIGVGNINGIARVLIDLTAVQANQELIFQAFEMVPTPRLSNTLTLDSSFEPVGQPLRADDVGSRGGDLATGSVPELTTAAMARWQAVGLSENQLKTLQGIDVRISDLPGDQLAATQGSFVLLDVNAAGNGWFIDGTAGDDIEFSRNATGELVANTAAAVDGIDALTVLMHEMGHMLGKSDHTGTSESELMSGVLAPGTRRLPTGFANPQFDPLDVNHDGRISTLDALVIINQVSVDQILSTSAAEQIAVSTTNNFDANRDGKVSSLDALAVINHLGASLASANGEQLSDAKQAIPSLASFSAVTVDWFDDDLLELLAHDNQLF